MKQSISFIIPCYNSELTLVSVVEEILQVFEKTLSENYSYEIILVNDCSSDKTSSVIEGLCQKDPSIIGVDFAKNFGQHSAILAGLRLSKGNYIICLDDDGQMPIESIPDMVEMLASGTDCVQGKYTNTKQSFFRRLGSRANSLMAEILLKKPKQLEMNSFWGARRFVIDEVVKYQGAYPYIGGLVLRTTSNIKNLEVVHRNREYGRSGYTLRKLIKLWMNGFTAFSEIPLRMASYTGLVSSFCGIILGIVTIIRKILNPDMATGYASLFCVILFVGGLVMMMLGIIGEYLGRTYININNAPQYVIRDIKNKNETDD